MFVKLTKPRRRKAREAGDVVGLADYEGRRLIEQGEAEKAIIHPLDHDGDGRKGGMFGVVPRARRKKPAAN